MSVGVIDGEPRLDLDYEEDVRADVDMNVVMSSEGRFVEVQGTGEHGTFDARRTRPAARSRDRRASAQLDAAQRQRWPHRYRSERTALPARDAKRRQAARASRRSSRSLGLEVVDLARLGIAETRRGG